MTAPTAENVVDVWNDSIRLRFKVTGQGPALVYLHPAAGLAWDGFLDRLAENHTVYAPEFPGTSSSDPYAIHKVDDLWQVVLLYEEAIRKLDIGTPILVGQSFGGMLAAELAAAYPERFSKLVLLDPIGLWRDDAPVANWITAPASDLPALLFADPTGRRPLPCSRRPTIRRRRSPPAPEWCGPWAARASSCGRCPIRDCVTACTASSRRRSWCGARRTA